MKDWERFLMSYGRGARHHELAAVLGKSVEEISRARDHVPSARTGRLMRFPELFTLWHGRAPRDSEYPAPLRSSVGWEWQAREDALLARLVGRLGVMEISRTLTERLRRITGDRRAKRDRCSVLMRLQRIGLETRDIIGGITASAAGREIGSYTPVWQAIRDKRLKAHKVGSLLVISHAEWARFKAQRVFPPAGYVQLTTLKRPLGIRSDKLSEWARMGYVPTALRCNPCGTRARNTQFGTWYISAQMAKKLIADRRAGRPMPWWGKPEPSNLVITFRLWRRRKHPRACETCATIWGRKGAPSSYDDYAVRYPPLALGAKRHLTMPWSSGLTIPEVARLVGRSVSYVNRALDNGALEARRIGRTRYISKTEASRWKARRFPNGACDRSWMSLATARKLYLFTHRELRAFIEQGKLKKKIGTNGPMTGITYVPRHQVCLLRERIGFSEAQAARRAGISVQRLRTLLRGVNWRGAPRIPLLTVQAVIKRLYSQDKGLTISEAARELNVTTDWIHEHVLDGTIRIQRARFDKRRIYITQPMLQRLRHAKRHPLKRERFNADWLHVSEAAMEAGVAIGTLEKWVARSQLSRRRSLTGWRYHRHVVRRAARRYWKAGSRLTRAVPPAWFTRESEMEKLAA